MYNCSILTKKIITVQCYNISYITDKTNYSHNILTDKTNHTSVCFDTGCTMASTYCLDDFKDPPHKGKFRKVHTANGDILIEGFGLIEWHSIDSNGNDCKILIPGYYIPDSDQ